VLLTHGIDAAQDRVLKLPRIARGEYAAPCAPLPAARWRISVDEPAGAWSLRGGVEGDLASVELHARDPDGAVR
jgi:hypothetical protein